MTPSEERQIEQAYQDASRDDPELFIRGLTIPSVRGPKLFEDCIADFQARCFSAICPSLKAVRDGDMPEHRRFLLERTKKASKDGDIGCCLLWPLAFATRPLFMQVGAADRDQAGIVKRRMTDTLYYNPWLQEMISAKAWTLTGSNGLATLEIVAADIAGSHGETPDILVVNELSHVTKWEFIENLLDNADGVPQGIVIAATNAGFKNTPAFKLREVARKSWFFNRVAEPAPWLNEKDIAGARERNSQSRFNRLWKGVWVSGKGDALDEDDINRVINARKGPTTNPESGWKYVGGLDLGVSHDHAGIAVVGVNEQKQKIRICQVVGWEPDSRTGEVDLMEVENACYALYKTYRPVAIDYDPSQAKLMAQRLSRKGVPMRELTFTGGNLTRMAESLLQVVKGGTLEGYEDLDGRIRRDFGKFYIVEKSYGYKLEAVSDEEGHADVGTAIVITLPRAVAMLQGSRGLDPEDNIGLDNEDDELSEQDVKDLPPELADIYGMYDDEPKSRKRTLTRGINSD